MILDYEQWVKADNSTVFIDHENYYIQNPAILRYKGKDNKEVGRLSYEFSDAYGSTWHSNRSLNEDLTLRLEDIGGYGFGVREDETYTVDVEWDGRKESIELKAITK
ncbi:MAG: hypothetical protein JL56_16685 [Desulfotomaculum sp. BICA1-6]|nr:MAG: hypothetical protein JL56_16685 [Desulfotomaculum sp. BICA1-6]KUO61599.1 MAG: hypothetical protein APF84_13790 [Gracilibacter sp. BRH_c7a]